MRKRKVGRPGPAAAADLTNILIETGMAMFLERGFSSTSVDAVVAKAGTSKVTFYSRFRSKEELLERGIEEMGVRIVTEAAVDVDHDLPFAERLNALGHRLLDMVLLPYTIALDRLATAESYRFPQIAHIAHANGTIRVVAILKAFLEDAVARGELKPVDVTLLAEVYMDLLLAFVRRAAHKIGSTSSDDEAKARLDSINLLLFNGLINPAA